MTYMHEPSKVQTVRLPISIWDEIAKEASENSRSFNQVLVLKLKDHLGMTEQKKSNKELAKKG